GTEERGGQRDVAVGPVDGRDDGHVGGDRAGEGGDRAAVVPQDHAGGGVDAFGGEGGTGPYGRRSAEEQVGQGERVDPEVEQGATGQVRVAQSMLGPEPSGQAEGGVDRGDLADQAVGDGPVQSPDRGVVAHPHGFHEEQVPGPGQVDQFGGLGE